MARLEEPKIKDLGVGFLERRCSPVHQLGQGSVAVSSASGVWSNVAAIWRFRTFYRLTKPLLVSIFTGSIARSANLPVFSLLRGRF